jgi:hypothetical protein
MPIVVYRLLLEALRRWLFTPGQPHLGSERLDEAWLGLGTYTVYKQAIEAGLMTYVHKPNPGYIQWWRLTPKGAAIVQGWIDAGVMVENYEVKNPPPIPTRQEYLRMIQGE